MGCLAILMIFYKLCLESLSIHKFKRFYLLGALFISAIIPFITFIEYVEPQLETLYIEATPSMSEDLLSSNVLVSEQTTNYLPEILWFIYGLGILLFGLKFCINLFNIISKINKNEKKKHGNIITVLVEDLISPHTFFKYIFLNKTKFKNNIIPKEVLLHEKTHANQKHSLDILFIEFLQIIFWFNPLLYFIKKDIKLNHEFLADNAVLKQGIDSSTYQKTLLSFTIKDQEIQLANAINYSLIKKRFTIMKTKSSSKIIWIRTLLLLPLLSFLLFSFSSRETIEILTQTKLETQTELLPTINGIECKNCEINLTSKAIESAFLETNKGIKIKQFKIKFPGKPTETINGNMLNQAAKDYLKASKNGILVQIFNIKTEKQTIKYHIIIKLVSKSNKNNSNSLAIKKGEKSNIPPPSKSPEPLIKKEKDANISLNKTDKHNLSKNEWTAPPSSPTLSRLNKGLKKRTIPAPAYPKSVLGHVRTMSKKGADFYYNGNKITSDEAEALVFKNPELNISSQTNNGKSTVHLSEKGMTIINGKVVNQKALKTTTNNFVINADSIEELKNFNWLDIEDIFDQNNPEDLITLEFNCKQKVTINNSKAETFNFKISDKTKNLKSMIKKSQKVIRKLNP